MMQKTFYECVVKEQANVTGPPLAKVIAIDNREPVAGVIVCMTQIGEDGGDGGYLPYLAQEAGIADLNSPLPPGR